MEPLNNGHCFGFFFLQTTHKGDHTTLRQAIHTYLQSVPYSAIFLSQFSHAPHCVQLGAYDHACSCELAWFRLLNIHGLLARMVSTAYSMYGTVGTYSECHDGMSVCVCVCTPPTAKQQPIELGINQIYYSWLMCIARYADM